MEKQTGAQRNAEADRRNENSARALQPWKEQQYRRNPEEPKPSASFCFFLLSRFACKQGAGYYILDKNIAWIL